MPSRILAYRTGVLGRAYLATRTDANSFVDLSGNTSCFSVENDDDRGEA
jgi:hypothetical protein